MNNQYLELLREIKSCSFATVDKNGKPQIRIIDVMLIKDNRLFFCTARGKDFYNELLHSGHVAIIGMTKSYQTVRLSGDVVHMNDNTDIIDEIFIHNPVMENVYPEDSRYILDGFYIEDASIDFFDLSTKPITRLFDKIGKCKLELKGFEINDACIGCGKCATSCPQHCIVEGNPYRINLESCLHCGLCFENCPVGAIVRR